jgi:predicted dehydrogenase
MSYRVNFENENLIYENGGVFERRTDETEFEAEVSSGMGYYPEIRHFIDCVENDTEVMISPDDSEESIRIIEAEIASTDKNGQLEYLS